MGRPADKGEGDAAHSHSVPISVNNNSDVMRFVMKNRGKISLWEMR